MTIWQLVHRFVPEDTDRMTRRHAEELARADLARRQENLEQRLRLLEAEAFVLARIEKDPS
jgi:hypothetical protein